ncbi:hypothetical protein BCON_0181g00230 [Botryotinia convoluta]|uniref:Uncharacterized protein n=1 Tax=Botryotinia convoluta TaxID=54673 RepID=A0A4Z1HN79_9HELO|nr:hypothetical protein BCON_0181g00230 [Botryotinia convoluta]
MLILSSTTTLQYNNEIWQSTATSSNHKNAFTKTISSAVGGTHRLQNRQEDGRQVGEEEIAAKVYVCGGASLSKAAEVLLYFAVIGSTSREIVKIKKEGYSGVSHTRAQYHLLLHSTLESTHLNDRSLRCKSRLSIANDSPWHAWYIPQLKVTSRIECTIRTVVPLAFDRSAPKLVQAYMLRSDSITKLRGSDANSFTDVCDATSLLADSLHNRPEVLCLRKYTEIYHQYLNYARSASSNGTRKDRR